MLDYQLLTIGYATLDRFLLLSKADARVGDTSEYGKQMCLNYGDKIPVQEYHETLGGNSANAAVTGARLGVETATWAVMGQDDTGRLAKKIFKQEGVSTEYVQLDPSVQSAVHTILSLEGERTILSYGKLKNFALPDFRPIPYIYVTSLLDGGEVLFDGLIELVKKHTSTLVYQPGHIQLKIPPAQTVDFLKVVKIIIMNREEAEQYTGLKSLTSSRPEMKNIMHTLHSYGPEIAVVTDGKEGAYVSDGKELFFSGIEDVAVVERTGAGDAYASAFIIALMHGKTIPEAMKWGLLNSQGVIGKIGPQAGILHLHEMQTLLHNGSPAIEIKKLLL